MWEQRDRFLRVVVFVLAIYLIYGIFQLYRQGGHTGRSGTLLVDSLPTKNHSSHMKTSGFEKPLIGVEPMT